MDTLMTTFILLASSLLLLSHLATVKGQSYCALPKGSHVQNRTWEKYGPNGAGCGELRGWAMSHGCFASGNPNCAPTAPCTSGKCMCIYACNPGYCMTQFNPATPNIGDKSHGVRCNADGSISKIYKPNSPLCVPCAALNPTQGSPLVTTSGQISPATIVSNMTTSIPACGLIDPGVDDNLISGSVSSSRTTPLYVSMFPSWWYLSGVDAQAYLGPQGVSYTYFCVAKRSPDLAPPDGNAGFYSVLYTTGGKIAKRDSDGHYLAYGQIAFFGDYGAPGNANLGKCWKHLGNKCLPKYGARAWVCSPGQVITPTATHTQKCTLHCDIYWTLTTDPGIDGTTAKLCRRMPKCNLASCPDPNKCLTPSDYWGCSPVADVTLGQRIVYELYPRPS